MPELSAYDTLVLRVFLGCQSQWNYAGMGGRTGIPYERMKFRADLAGVEVTPLFVDKFDACVGEILHWDSERIKANTETDE